MDAGFPIRATMLVMAGGAIGAGLRFQTGYAAARLGLVGFPYATLAVNLLGGLMMGLLAGSLARSATPETARLFLGVGLLGGFTTFSAFSLELFEMTERGLGALALGYAALSLVGAFAALALGIGIARSLA